jgi:hypothetical protein
VGHRAHRDGRGVRWTRRPTTSVTGYPQLGALGGVPTLSGEPVSVEVVGYDFLEVVGAAVLVDRQPVQVIIDGRELDLDGARNLIAPLGELIEAVEEGTR